MPGRHIRSLNFLFPVEITMRLTALQKLWKEAPNSVRKNIHESVLAYLLMALADWFALENRSV